MPDAAAQAPDPAAAAPAERLHAPDVNSDSPADCADAGAAQSPEAALVPSLEGELGVLAHQDLVALCCGLQQQ